MRKDNGLRLDKVYKLSKPLAALLFVIILSKELNL
jgi:hypothetical protein